MEKTEKKLKIYQTEHGGKYYNHLPDGWRVAVLEDFYNHQGSLILEKPYLVQSMKTPGRYWANRVSKGFPYYGSDFNEFMSKELIYVMDGS